MVCIDQGLTVAVPVFHEQDRGLCRGGAGHVVVATVPEVTIGHPRDIDPAHLVIGGQSPSSATVHRLGTQPCTHLVPLVYTVSKYLGCQYRDTSNTSFPLYTHRGESFLYLLCRNNVC